jgi:hypothetical protein
MRPQYVLTTPIDAPDDLWQRARWLEKKLAQPGEQQGI